MDLNMQNSKPLKKKKSSEHNLVMDALVIEQTKLELTVTIQNIIEFYLQIFNDIIEFGLTDSAHSDHLVKCYIRLKNIYTTKKKLLSEDLRTLIKDVLIEYENINKLIQHYMQINRMEDIQKIMVTKKYAIEYRNISLKNALFIKNYAQQHMQ